MDSAISKLEKIINYNFKSAEEISFAVVHPGFKKSSRQWSKHFERLEFLGDRVLGLSLASYLYENFSSDAEGDLAVRMATLAGTDFLIELAKKTKMIECFSVPKDFFISKNKTSSSIADMMEAVFAAVFLDSNFETARKIILALYAGDINRIIYKEKDSKSHLQEIAQARNGDLPIYRLLKMEGDLHDPVFEVEVNALEMSEVGYGNTKKNAEHDAAARMIKKLKCAWNKNANAQNNAEKAGAKNFQLKQAREIKK